MNDPEIRKVEDKLLIGDIADKIGGIVVGDCEDEYCKENHDSCCLKDKCARHPTNGRFKDLPNNFGSYWV
ncbi:MAG: hypothetical protein GY861_12645 [bacterium]|nr:hypothetical protein [bacterium]